MSQPTKLMGVEAARGIAALLVVLVHAGSMLAGGKYLGELPLGGFSSSPMPVSTSFSS